MRQPLVLQGSLSVRVLTTPRRRAMSSFGSGLGAVAQFEKASLVAKLKAARDRKRTRDGKCEGRRSHLEMNPQLVALAKRLHRRNPKTGQRLSLRAIAAELASQGLVNMHGRPYAAASIQAMVQR